MGVGLFGWLALSAPRWLAAVALSPEATGYFILAVNLSMFVPSAVNLIGQSYSFPPLFAANRAGAAEAVLVRMTDRTAASMLVLGQAGLIALHWCGPWLVGPIVDPRYGPAMGWLLAAGGASLAGGTGPIFCNLLLARNHGSSCLHVTAWSAIFRIGVVAALAWAGSIDIFRYGLCILAWPTAALEWWMTRRILRRKAALPNAGCR